MSGTAQAVIRVQFKDFHLSPAGSSPVGIAKGSDGNMWFAEEGTGEIGRITASGAVTEFPVSGGPRGIAAGPDGNLWFTMSGAVGRITTSGVVTEFATTNGSIEDIVAGPDGNMWFTNRGASQIGRITPDGSTITLFPTLTASSQPMGIASGPDGNLWFAENTGQKIGRITPAGVVTEFPLELANPLPLDIVAGPDGNLWFTDYEGLIGKMSTAGQLLLRIDVPPPSDYGSAWAITAGPDGNLWFTDAYLGRIGVFPPTATSYVDVTMFATPSPSRPTGIAAGPKNTIWYTDDSFSSHDVNEIGKIRLH